MNKKAYIYPMRVIIVDDENTSSEVLERLIKHYTPSLEIIAICNKPTEAIDCILQKKPDLVFLDIEMPGMTGFDLLQKTQPNFFNIIFTTAHSQYGIKAIQFSALDYLLKPIDVDELVKAVHRAQELKNDNNILERIKILMENLQHMQNNNPFNRIALPTLDGLKLVFTSDIVRCMSSNNYTHVYLNTGEKIIISKTLKDVENIFTDYDFLRIHNSHLVNKNYIKKFIKTDQNTIIMSDGTEVEVSRRKKDELLKLLNL